MADGVKGPGEIEGCEDDIWVGGEKSSDMMKDRDDGGRCGSG